MKDIIIITIICIVLVVIASIGIKRHERVECQQWLKDSQTYEEWYATNWQVKMCSQFGINLDNVKKME